MELNQNPRLYILPSIYRLKHGDFASVELKQYLKLCLPTDLQAKQEKKKMKHISNQERSAVRDVSVAKVIILAHGGPSLQQPYQLPES